MEFNSVAITAAGSGVDAIALEWLEHTIRAEVSSILRWNKGGWWGRAFRSCGGLGGWCEADSILFDGAAAVGWWRTVGGVLEASSSPPGLKIEGEEGFQNVLGHRPEVALGQDGEFVSGDHILSSGIKVAGYVTAVVALEGLQAHPTQGGFREIRACEERGQLRNFAVDMVNIEASGF